MNDAKLLVKLLRCNGQNVVDDGIHHHVKFCVTTCVRRCHVSADHRAEKIHRIRNGGVKVKRPSLISGGCAFLDKFNRLLQVERIDHVGALRRNLMDHAAVYLCA